MLALLTDRKSGEVSTYDVPAPELRPGGILVAIADEPDGHGGRDDVRSCYFVVEPDGAQLRELASLIARGQLTAAVSQVFPLSALPEAFAAQRARRAPGKVIIDVAVTAGDGGSQRP